MTKVMAYIGSDSFEIDVPNPALLERRLAKPHIRRGLTMVMEQWLNATKQNFMVLTVGAAEINADRLGAELPAGPVKTAEYWDFVNNIRSFAI